MKVIERATSVDVISNSWAPWLAIPLIAFWGTALLFSVIGPLLAVAGIAMIALTARCRRWRFDAARREVRFAKGVLPWFLGPEATLVQRPGMVFTFSNTFLGAGERIQAARFADIERADVDVSTNSSTFALVLRMTGGATIGFGVGHESWGLAKKREAAEAINRLLSSMGTPTALPSSTDAESYAGSPIAVPTLTDQTDHEE